MRAAARRVLLRARSSAARSLGRAHLGGRGGGRRRSRPGASARGRARGAPRGLEPASRTRSSVTSITSRSYVAEEERLGRRGPRTPRREAWAADRMRKRRKQRQATHASTSTAAVTEPPTTAGSVSVGGVASPSRNSLPSMSRNCGAARPAAAALAAVATATAVAARASGRRPRRRRPRLAEEGGGGVDGGGDVGGGGGTAGAGGVAGGGGEGGGAAGGAGGAGREGGGGWCLVGRLLLRRPGPGEGSSSWASQACCSRRSRCSRCTTGSTRRPSPARCTRVAHERQYLCCPPCRWPRSRRRCRSRRSRSTTHTPIARRSTCRRPTCSCCGTRAGGTSPGETPQRRRAGGIACC